MTHRASQHTAPQNTNEAPTGPTVVRLDLAGAADAKTSLAPASALVRVARPDHARRLAARLGELDDHDAIPALNAELVALDDPSAIDLHPAAASATRLDATRHALLPPTVNAHTHLDLSSLGCLPAEQGFEAWLAAIRLHRPTTPESIARSVGVGVRLSLASGVLAVGDIAGGVEGLPCDAAIRALLDSPLRGVAYLEFFAIGAAERERMPRIEQALAELPDGRADLRIGLQPHAPYSASLDAYAWAARQTRPLSTHLAETRSEHELIARGTGSRRALLEALHLWNDSLAAQLGHGATPTAHLLPALDAAKRSGHPFLAAHVADASDEDLRILADTDTAVAYCPRAASFFDTPRELGPHRYREMLDAGVNVCLGADSIAGLPAGADNPAFGAFGPIAEARLLHARDHTDPATLLAMATTRGARALGLDPTEFTLACGATPAGLALCQIDDAASDARAAVLNTDAPVRFLCIRTNSRESAIDA